MKELGKRKRRVLSEHMEGLFKSPEIDSKRE